MHTPNHLPVEKQANTSVAPYPDEGESPEREFVTRLRARDAAAFSRLLELYHGSLLRLALAFVPSRAVAEEVVQETWLGVIQGLDRFEGRSALKTWIFRILTNRAKSRGAREHRSLPFSELSFDDGEYHGAVDAARFKADGMWGLPPQRWQAHSPEKLASDHQALTQLEAAIAALPPPQRAVVTLRDVEGLSSDEVCNILELSDTNQRVLLHRARSKLRSVLEQHMEAI